MHTSELSELAAFDAVARLLSFRRASEERGVTASAISHAISNLETRVGVRLLHRSTRSVSLTDAGATLHAQLAPAFGKIDSALDALNRFRETAFGRVRINVPNSIAPFVIGPVIGPLLEQHPSLQLEIVATDRLVDIVDAGFDAGIRLGESLREGMTAVRLEPRLRLVVVGSPAYFERRPVPQRPQELEDHVGIQNMYPSGVRYPWYFERDGEQLEYQPTGSISLDDHELMIQTALAGVALAYVWEDRALPHIQSGRLIHCLQDWVVPESSLYFYYPSDKHVSAGLRAVIELLRAPSEDAPAPIHAG
jgi:DNA-binding transcriptional LysR family regulator